MEYRCISADGHIDLWWLPHDLFTSNASKALKDRMPRVVKQGDDALMWTTPAGPLGFANGKGSVPAMGSAHGVGAKIVNGKQHRIDRMASTGLYSDGSQGVFRPTTPELRLKDQDRDGVQAEVMYGLLHMAGRWNDREAAVEFFRIYNDWLANFCSYNPQRFVGLASIPSYTVEVAVAEINRAAKIGLGGLDVAITHDMKPLWHPYWDPLWRTANDTNLAVHFHTIGPPPGQPVDADLDDVYKHAAKAARTATTQMFVTNILASIIHSGALERYPKLRIVFGESGIGWIPYVLDRMDYEFEDHFKTLIPYMKMKPSEYWRRQCRATFQNDRIGARLLDVLGEETVMWGSDYPHSDGVFPDSQEYIEDQFNNLPQPTKRKIICENAGKFYGLIH